VDWKSLSPDNNKCRILVSMAMNFRLRECNDVLDHKKKFEILSKESAVVIPRICETVASVGPILILSLKRS